MPEQDVTTGQLMLIEYQSVKDEQKARIGFRDNLLYVTLAVVAAVAATSAQSGRTSRTCGATWAPGWPISRGSSGRLRSKWCCTQGCSALRDGRRTVGHEVVVRGAVAAP
ncbi:MULTISPECIES: hypothetical protein [unclassified Streptomyces]|uniref:hypothetical protein n=1 Tax=unclassified Streptomyces TaxID=2593676 RepID=UPI00365AE185